MTSAPIRIDPGKLALEPLDLDPAAFHSPLPVQNYHLVFADEAIGMAVGIWDTTTMQEAFGPYPGDEYITVLEGSFSILDADGNAVTGHAGQSATFRNGIPVSWKQEGYLRKVYLTLMDPGAGVPRIASAEGGVIVLDGTPSGKGGRVVFRNDAGTMTVEHRVHAGTDLPPAATDRHELCRNLSGEIVLTDGEGRLHRFAAGDHLFLPKGVVVSRRTIDGTEAYHVFVGA